MTPDRLAPNIKADEQAEFICPFCRRSWRVTEAMRQAILGKLRSWDRRLVHEETLADSILSLIGEMLAEPEPNKTD